MMVIDHMRATAEQERISAEEYLTKAEGARRAGNLLKADEYVLCAAMCHRRATTIEHDIAALEGIET